ncbi:MAG: hypothetical protein QOG62_1932 [Thermoleophilaceae bacterium]|jgi:hypothetical protein|nr:hypothetical protein [Thermoleophilaceae bacterium]
MNRKLPIVLVILALTVLAAGCGGDDEKNLPPLTSTPELVPPSSTPTSTTPGLTTGTSTTSPSNTVKIRTIDEAPSNQGGGGGGGTEEPPATEPTNTPDSPKNDTPANPDSSAGRFEQFCASDPKSCGN